MAAESTGREGVVAGRMRHSELTELERAVGQAFARGERLDLRARRQGSATTGDRQVRAAVLVALLTGLHQVKPVAVPALRLVGAEIRGAFDLESADVAHLVELDRCTFDAVAEFQLARFRGLRLTRCRLPGLRARNLRVDSDLELDGTTCTGSVDLTDATVHGTVRLAGAVLRSPQDHALLAARLRVSGSLQASGLRATGEVRLRGAHIGGSAHLGGAQLHNPDGDALEATGLVVDGNLSCDRDGGRFTAHGRVVLAGARVGGDAVFSGATLSVAEEADHQVLVLPRGTADGTAALVADRMRVDGNVELDTGFTSAGSVRLPNASIGGYLRLSGACLGRQEALAGLGTDADVQRVPVALVADGVQIGGDLEARGSVAVTDGEERDETPAGGPLRAYGQVRLVDAHVRGSASLSGAHLVGPGIDVLFADRLQVGGTLFLRNIRASGSLRLQNAHIGSTVDCTGAQLTEPRRRPDGSRKPSLDARVASIGKDLLCSYGFLAAGGVRVRFAEVGKMASFTGAFLGDAGNSLALNAYGLTAQQLVLRFAAPPQGRVALTRARVISLSDAAELWAATGGVALEDFAYQAAVARPEVDVRTRLSWLRRVLPDYTPGPYEQLASVYRVNGDEERAEQVLIAKQQRRFAELGPAGRVWGFLQEWTVGYGYRPWLAVLWLAVFWLGGALWFAGHPMERLDDDQHPVWNPWLLSADTLLPIVNLGQDGMWRITGASQWISGVLTAVGWILASTAAAGATRVLKRS
ncbi:hypothetical protein LX15_005133 [Streptoalloteichus tenebrarius]|uniref:Membrane-associated oxidoreductase n=1 Tax=Streptoalloteichus tenebrarius (strain ATCC 17920 / DSM 40477 / JCM 4838 / CBS 697.72 / NBRC 16177 / NCIMB 11028 / NRRL B-12390 / A12253. 1 / ISP 5477) TaxID=1933 RepID=A0ABT1I0V8_STRSD|nr:hypothetical protein [Streptoalloteichus tenebrarius]MCP2261407.1 hypothetical protein [Streptoalloteichus tenebrarius]BFF02010.1 oxidoreductase [Streptoalloteichus tenebrarius]